MLKRAIVLLLLLSMAVTLFGCGENKPDGPHAVIDDPPNSLIYGFGEEILFDNDSKYIKFESFEVCEAYEGLEPTEGGSGYYVILGVSTNIPESEFTTEGRAHSSLCVYDDRPETFHLTILSFDTDNAKLVLEIPKVKDADYAKLMTLKIEDQPLEHNVYMHISFDMTCFLDFPIIDGEQYAGRKFEGQLEWGA